MEAQKGIPLTEAVEGLSALLQQIKATGVARVAGHEVKLGGPVALEVEAELDEEEGELEFELKWPFLPPVTVAEALRQIKEAVTEMKSDNVLTVRGKQTRIGDLVELDLDVEGDRSSGELEVEMEWPAPEGEPLAKALDRMASAIAGVESGAAVRANGREVPMGELVTLRIEAEGDQDEGEIEFEVNWPPIKERSLAEAVEEVSRIIAEAKSGAVRINGKDIGVSEEVDVDVELSGDEREGELEVKIAWRVG